MELGFIGLGKMGMNMVTRLQQGKHRVVAYDRAMELIKQAEALGPVREFLDSTNYRRFYQLIAYFEKHLGARWPELL